jgi:hypothetical protein
MAGPQLPKLMTYPHILDVLNINLNVWPLADIKNAL